jgi:predicted RND superfamily exporter protein
MVCSICRIDHGYLISFPKSWSDRSSYEAICVPIRFDLHGLSPNAFPLAVTGAAMLWLGLPLHLSSVAVFCVLLGIAVDDTIHYLVCYRREKEEGQPTEDALWRTTVRVGRPIVTTTLILIFGFGIVMLSPIPAIRLFSALLCLGFLLALCGDLVVLPALLACTAGRIPTRRASE